MNRTTINHVVGYFFCFALYLYIYSNYIVHIFAYMGYEDNLSLVKTTFSFIGLLTCTLLIREKNLPSEFFLHLALGLVLLPSLVMFSGSDLPYIYAGTTLSSFFLLATIPRLANFKKISFFSLKAPNTILDALLFSTVAVLVSIFAMGGGKYFNLDISLVYEFRSDAADNLPSVFAYINPIITKVAIPFGAVIAFSLKKWVKLVILLISALLFFALTAHKSVLAYPFVAILIFGFSRHGNQTKFFIYSLVGIGFISLVELILLSQSDLGYWFSSLIYRRAILTPSLLNWNHIDWFSNNPFYYWADSRLTLGLVNPPSHLSSPHLIGLQFYGAEEMSANTGWIGSGFANAGFAGVMLYTAMIGVLLGFLNSYSRSLGTPIIIAFFSSLILTILLSADFFTSLLTHGLIVAALILTVSPKMNSKGNK